MGKIEEVNREHTKKEKEDIKKTMNLIDKMDVETCLKFIKQCDGLDMLLDMTAREAVDALVDILIDEDETYPNGYSDFIKEVKANDFTMTHEKNVKSMGQNLRDTLKTIEENKNEI